jgi:hypothetical protein
MNYTLIFYVSILVFIYQSITGNQNMIEQSFKAVVILGLAAILSSFHNK